MVSFLRFLCLRPCRQGGVQLWRGGNAKLLTQGHVVDASRIELNLCHHRDSPLVLFQKLTQGENVIPAKARGRKHKVQGMGVVLAHVRKKLPVRGYELQAAGDLAVLVFLLFLVLVHAHLEPDGAFRLQ